MYKIRLEKDKKIILHNDYIYLLDHYYQIFRMYTDFQYVYGDDIYKEYGVMNARIYIDHIYDTKSYKHNLFIENHLKTRLYERFKKLRLSKYNIPRKYISSEYIIVRVTNSYIRKTIKIAKERIFDDDEYSEKGYTKYLDGSTDDSEVLFKKEIIQKRTCLFYFNKIYNNYKIYEVESNKHGTPHKEAGLRYYNEDKYEIIYTPRNKINYIYNFSDIDILL